MRLMRQLVESNSSADFWSRWNGPVGAQIRNISKTFYDYLLKNWVGTPTSMPRIGYVHRIAPVGDVAGLLSMFDRN
jgi:hypothetical protein